MEPPANVTKHYTYRVHWSNEDHAYVGTVTELPSLSWLDDSALAAFTGIQQVAMDVVAEMVESDEEPSTAIADRA